MGLRLVFAQRTCHTEADGPQRFTFSSLPFDRSLRRAILPNGGKPGGVKTEGQVCLGLRSRPIQPHPDFLCESRRLEETLRFRSDSLGKLRHPIGGLRSVIANPFRTGIEQEIDIPSRTLQPQGASESAREVSICVPNVADSDVCEVGCLRFGRLLGVVRKDRDPDHQSS
jgi:hypothetical protein